MEQLHSVEQLHPWLRFDMDLAVENIAARMREIVGRVVGRRGVVVGVSGGIDSSVCAALSVRAFGPGKVFALLMPERDSSSASVDLGGSLCGHLGITFEKKEIASTLEAIGCYKWRDEAIKSVFPEYDDRWKSKIVIAQNLLESDRFNYFNLVVQNPEGEMSERRLSIGAYLQIVAATNFKQRIRKTLEYFHADRLNYAVVGTPNRLEYDQGFFVKNGDGAADVKPIAHLYKSQVYALGRHLGLPNEIVSARPTTDTYSLVQGQDEFYFVLPYEVLDIVLCGLNTGKTGDEIAAATKMSTEQVERVVRDIKKKRITTKALHMKPVLVESVPQITF